MKKKLKRKVLSLKRELLLVLFGIKPKRNTLRFKKLNVPERELSPEEFNKWIKTLIK